MDRCNQEADVVAFLQEPALLLPGPARQHRRVYRRRLIQVHHAGNKLKVRGPRRALPAHHIPLLHRGQHCCGRQGLRQPHSRSGASPDQERLCRRLFSLLRIPRIVASDAIQHGSARTATARVTRPSRASCPTCSATGGRHPPVPGRNHRPDQRPVVRTRHRASQGTAPGSVPGQLARLIPGPASTRATGCLRPRRHTGHDGNGRRIRDRHHGGWTIAIRCDGTLIHVERDPQGGLTWQQCRLGNLVTPTRVSRERDLATRARIHNGPLGQHFPAAIEALTAAGFGLSDPPSQCPPSASFI